MHAKLAVVLALLPTLGSATLMGHLRPGTCAWSGRQTAGPFNELPTLWLVLVVMLVVFKVPVPHRAAHLVSWWPWGGPWPAPSSSMRAGGACEGAGGPGQLRDKWRSQALRAIPLVPWLPAWSLKFARRLFSLSPICSDGSSLPRFVKARPTDRLEPGADVEHVCRHHASKQQAQVPCAGNMLGGLTWIGGLRAGGERRRPSPLGAGRRVSSLLEGCLVHVRRLWFRDPAMRRLAPGPGWPRGWLRGPAGRCGVSKRSTPRPVWLAGPPGPLSPPLPAS